MLWCDGSFSGLRFGAISRAWLRHPQARCEPLFVVACAWHALALSQMVSSTRHDTREPTHLQASGALETLTAIRPTSWPNGSRDTHS